MFRLSHSQSLSDPSSKRALAMEEQKNRKRMESEKKNQSQPLLTCWQIFPISVGDRFDQVPAE